MPEQYDTHNLSLTDLPHVLRIGGDSLVLDSRLRWTTNSAASGNWFSSMMPYTSRHTLVARYEEQRVVGQFYITPDEHGAQVVYLAPHHPPAHGDDSAWLLMLDAMVREAGRRGAHTLMAELDEDSPLFTTLRQSGFAVYARQLVWQLGPGASVPPKPPLAIRPATEADAAHVMLLYQRTVPSLLKQVIAPPEPDGYLYHEGGDLMAFVGVAEGRDGIFLMPYIDHRLQANPAEVLLAVLGHLPRVGRRQLAIRVRRYQGWMHPTLADAGFTTVARQAVMVRHITAGVHSPGFASLSHKLANGIAPRRTERVPEVCMRQWERARKDG